jgi:hypothetical protein
LFERCTRFSSRAHQVRLELGRALHQGTQSEPKEHLHGVVAWFLTQLTTQVFPFFEIPDSAVRFVVIALAAGFPIAMVTVCVPVVPVLSFPPPIIPPRLRRKFIRRSSSDGRIKSFLV